MDTKPAKGRNRTWAQADQPQGQEPDRILKVEKPETPSAWGTVGACVRVRVHVQDYVYAPQCVSACVSDSVCRLPYVAIHMC